MQPPATAPAPPPQYGYQAAPAAGGYAASTYAGAPGYAPAYQGGYVQPRKVGFGEAIRRAFAGWGDYKSRSTVAEYWWFVLFSVIIGIPMYVLFLVAVGSSFSTTTAADGTPTITSNGVSGLGLLTLFLLGVVYVVLFFVGLALAVRRLHDTDRSGWWYLISLVPFGSIVLLVFFVGASTPGPNRFGPVPQ